MHTSLGQKTIPSISPCRYCDVPPIIGRLYGEPTIRCPECTGQATSKTGRKVAALWNLVGPTNWHDCTKAEKICPYCGGTNATVRWQGLYKVIIECPDCDHILKQLRKLSVKESRWQRLHTFESDFIERAFGMATIANIKKKNLGVIKAFRWCADQVHLLPYSKYAFELLRALHHAVHFGDFSHWDKLEPSSGYTGFLLVDPFVARSLKSRSWEDLLNDLRYHVASACIINERDVSFDFFLAEDTAKWKNAKDRASRDLEAALAAKLLCSSDQDFHIAYADEVLDDWAYLRGPVPYYRLPISQPLGLSFGFDNLDEAYSEIGFYAVREDDLDRKHEDDLTSRTEASEDAFREWSQCVFRKERFFQLPDEQNGQGVVYLLTDGESYKIGFTEGDPEKRLKQLQTGNPRRLSVVASIPGSREKETRVHEYFSQYRGIGEWFQAPRLDLLSVFPSAKI